MTRSTRSLPPASSFAANALPERGVDPALPVARPERLGAPDVRLAVLAANLEIEALIPRPTSEKRCLQRLKPRRHGGDVGHGQHNGRCSSKHAKNRHAVDGKPEPRRDSSDGVPYRCIRLVSTGEPLSTLDKADPVSVEIRHPAVRKPPLENGVARADAVFKRPGRGRQLGKSPEEQFCSQVDSMSPPFFEPGNLSVTYNAGAAACFGSASLTQCGCLPIRAETRSLRLRPTTG